MESEKTYSRSYDPKDYKNRIQYAAEKLYQEKDDLFAKIIDWNAVTVKYMGYNLPEDVLNDIYWKDYRSLWVMHINQYFAQHEYACLLFVKYDKGVELITGKNAVKEIFIKGCKKILNASKNQIKRSDELIMAYSRFPSLLKILISQKNFWTEGIYSLSGRVENERIVLTEKDKKILRKFIKKSLPPSENN